MPQGSVLGPLLFVVFINDIDGAVESVTIIMKFADDTKLGHVVMNEQDSATLQASLDKLTDWATKWGMSFNTDKCKVMHIGRGNQQQDYNMNSKVLSKTESEKDIGVFTHKSLKPSLQCKEAARRANGVLSQILRSFHYRDKKTFVQLYTTYVRPHLEFSTPAWNPWLQKNIDVLENVQKRALKMISGLSSRDYDEQLSELKMLSLKNRRQMFDMVQTFKIIHSFDNVDRSTWFEFVEEREGRTTRLSEDPLNLKTKRINTEIRRNFFSNRVINSWNKIPSTIKNAKTVASFKRQYTELMLQQPREQELHNNPE